MRGKSHSDETRAQVVAALLSGQGVGEVSRALSVPKATVSRIKNELAPEVLQRSRDAQTEAAVAGAVEGLQQMAENDEPTDEEIDAVHERDFERNEAADEAEIETSTLARLEQVGTQKNTHSLDQLISIYLRANLDALARQTVVAGDFKYIARQSAENLAVLHGVMADKAIRILEAAAAAQPLEDLNQNPNG